MEGLRQSGLPLHNYPLLEVLNICFYSFRMPLFFIISGLFLSAGLHKKGLRNYVNGRFKIVFYPLLVWGSIQITMQFLMKNYVNAHREPMDYLNLIINPRRIEQFWYLNALFFVGAIYALLKTTLRINYWQQLLIGMVFYAVAGMLRYTETNGYLFTDILNFYIYFCFGDIISGYLLGKKTKKAMITAPSWLMASFIVFLASQYLYTIVNIHHNSDFYVGDKMPALALPIALSGCAFTIQIAFLLQRFGILKWLRVIGYHSLYIYLTHVMIIAAVRIFLVYGLHINSVPMILVPAMLAGVVLPILLYNVSVRVGAWWLFSLRKPVDEINFHAQKIAIV